MIVRAIIAAEIIVMIANKFMERPKVWNRDAFNTDAAFKKAAMESQPLNRPSSGAIMKRSNPLSGSIS
jgi:hypothetical protein